MQLFSSPFFLGPGWFPDAGPLLVDHHLVRQGAQEAGAGIWLSPNRYQGNEPETESPCEFQQVLYQDSIPVP